MHIEELKSRMSEGQTVYEYMREQVIERKQENDEENRKLRIL
jgi:hypothetical protein